MTLKLKVLSPLTFNPEISVLITPFAKQLEDTVGDKVVVIVCKVVVCKVGIVELDIVEDRIVEVRVVGVGVVAVGAVVVVNGGTSKTLGVM